MMFSSNLDASRGMIYFVSSFLTLTPPLEPMFLSILFPVYLQFVVSVTVTPLQKNNDNK
jgi:hypothetical protein